MAENVGRVEITADIDGKALDAQVRAIGERAGQMMARSLSKSFNTQMKQLSSELQGGMRGVRDEVEKTTKAINRQAGAWKRLPHGFRQFTFYTALFATLGQNIAALASATGAGLTVMGGALVNFGVGVGVVVAAFQNLTGDLDKLPESVRPAAKAFQDLSENFSNLQKAIQVRALKNAEGAFKSFGKTIDALVPAFEEVADVVDDLITSFAKSIAPGTKNFENLNRVIKNSGPIFSRLTKAVGTFSAGLLAIFANASFNRSVGEFVGWIELLAKRFDEFANSPALEEWLSHARSVFGAVGRLLDATGRMLNDLVTPQSIERLVAFIDGLADFMPHLTVLLDTLGRLDIFGLIVQGLNDFATALEPLAVPLGEFAEGLNRIVSIAIDQIANDLAGLATALEPLVSALADFVNDVDEQAIRDIADALLIVGSVAVVTGVGKLAGALLGLSRRAGGIIALSVAVGALKDVFENWDVEGPSASLDRLFAGMAAGGGIAAWIASIGTGITVGAAALYAGIAALAVGLVTTFIDTITGESWLEKLFEDWNNGILLPFYAMIGESFSNAFTTIDLWGDDFFNKGGLQASFEGVRTAVNDFFYGISDAISVWFGALAINVGVWLSGLWTTVSTWFSSLILNVTIWLGQVWSGITTWFGEVIAGWNAFWAGIGQTVTDAWNYIVGWIAFQIALIQRNIASTLAQIGAGWNGFWSGLGGIVSSVWTGIQTSVRTGVNAVISMINGMINAINRALDSISNITGGLVDLNIPNLPRAARGAFTTGPTIAGEAGPELIIPLTGALHKVNPAVRPYAEMVRGGGSGTGGGNGKIVNVQPGAIVVQTVAPPMQVASALIDRLVANAAI